MTLTRIIPMSTLYVLNEGPEAPRAKLGISHGLLWQRLRVLNQGNWRELQFSAIWVGPRHKVEQFEQAFKHSHPALGGGGLSEWFSYTPLELEQHVDSGIQAPILKITNSQVVPYCARKGSACPIVSYHDLYHEALTHSGFDYLTYYAQEHRHRLYGITAWSDYGLHEAAIVAEGRQFEFR